MPEYRRAWEPGGTFFITVVTCDRSPLFADETAQTLLGNAIRLTREERPFNLVASVLLPDHLHLLLTLPDDDGDFSIRIAAIKGRFSRRWLERGGAEQSQSESRVRQEYRGIWQKRFWEHRVRDEDDLNRCCDYIHYNPVKHGVATCPHAWPRSTFHRFVAERKYAIDWMCSCHSPLAVTPRDIPGAEMDR